MSRIHVETERTIEATPAQVYAFLTDYREKRPQILPPNYVDYRVEQGGKGAGTIFSYTLHAGNRQRPYRMRVDEPAKDSVLTENDLASTLVTTWSLVPAGDVRRTRVRLTTEWEGGKGVGGFFERTFAPGALRRIYDDMLGRLEKALGSVASAR